MRSSTTSWPSAVSSASAAAFSRRERAVPGAPRVDCSRAGQRRNLLFPFLYSHHDTRWLHASAAVSFLLSASLAHAAHKHAPPEAASASAPSAPPDVAVSAPSAVFRLAKPNQWRTANMVALRSARRAWSCRRRVRVTPLGAWTKFDGERRRARRVPGVPGENPSPLNTVSICVRPYQISYAQCERDSPKRLI